MFCDKQINILYYYSKTLKTIQFTRFSTFCVKQYGRLLSGTAFTIYYLSYNCNAAAIQTRRLAGGRGDIEQRPALQQSVYDELDGGARHRRPVCNNRTAYASPEIIAASIPSLDLSDVFADYRSWQPQSFLSNPVLGTSTPTPNYWWALFYARCRHWGALTGRWPSRRVAWPQLATRTRSMHMCDSNRCPLAPMKRNTPPRLSTIFVWRWYSIYTSILVVDNVLKQLSCQHRRSLRGAWGG